MTELAHRDVTLHLGLHKTGTTWLQKEVFEKMKNIHFYHEFQYIDTLVPDDDGKIVFSCEWWSGSPHLLDPVQKRFVLAKRLHTVFPNARVVVGFRDPVDWVKSLWKQHVLERGTCSYKQFLARFDRRYCEFMVYQRFLEQLFPEAFFYWYDDMRRDKMNFIQELCDFIDVPVPDWEDRVYRRSLSCRQTTCLRCINRCLPLRLRGPMDILVKQLMGSWVWR